MGDLPKDATFLDLTGLAKQRAEYIRRVLANLETIERSNRDKVMVRMGTQGTGLTPHYKFEADVPIVIRDEKGKNVSEHQLRETFLIYNGTNHKLMKAFDSDSIRDEHWSSKPMFYSDVQTMLGEARVEAKA